MRHGDSSVYRSTPGDPSGRLGQGIEIWQVTLDSAPAICIVYTESFNASAMQSAPVQKTEQSFS